MRSFYGNNKQSYYFEGWYFKHQSEHGIISFIPAFHINNIGQKSASLQIITEDESYHLDLPVQLFHAREQHLFIKFGKCIFSERGCKLDLQTGGVKIKGTLQYSNITPLSYDIMGPFRFVPLMECRHSIFSLRHEINGSLQINDKLYYFNHGIGYIEGDRGTSFPSQYLWSQCNRKDGHPDCVMLSVATIPFLGFHFTGCIASILHEGKQYRLATYCGAKVLYAREDAACIKQKDMLLRIQLITSQPHKLKAPTKGCMSRIIHESVSCTVHYEFLKNNKLLFDFISTQASFESSGRTKNSTS